MRKQFPKNCHSPAKGGERECQKKRVTTAKSLQSLVIVTHKGGGGKKSD